jgi:hypothetical protein
MVDQVEEPQPVRVRRAVNTLSGQFEDWDFSPKSGPKNAYLGLLVTPPEGGKISDAIGKKIEQVLRENGLSIEYNVAPPERTQPARY